MQRQLNAGVVEQSFYADGNCPALNQTKKTKNLLVIAISKLLLPAGVIGNGHLSMTETNHRWDTQVTKTTDSQALVVKFVKILRKDLPIHSPWANSVLPMKAIVPTRSV